jgi:hypothetical protein
MGAKKKFEFDIVLSFAGEDRSVAKKLYGILHKRDVTVFYDFAERSGFGARTSTNICNRFIAIRLGSAWCLSLKAI